jgi:hypothetical protein
VLAYRWQPGQSGNPGGLSRSQRLALAAARDILASAEPDAASALVEAVELARRKKDAALMVRAAQVLLMTSADLRDRTAKGDGSIDVTPRKLTDDGVRELLARALELAATPRESVDATSPASDATATGDAAAAGPRVSGQSSCATTQAKELSDAELDALASLP